jgi:hypothetical protein
VSLYNLLHGVNPIAPLLKAVIGIDQEGGQWQSGRFRDIFLSADGSEVVLYTRNGGGNREHWHDDQPAGKDCRCPGCIITYHLPTHPDYIRDEDDDFDCTYASVHFRVSERFRPLTGVLATGADPKSISDKFEETLQEMRAMTPEQMASDPRFAPLINMLEPLVSALKEQP